MRLASNTLLFFLLVLTLNVNATEPCDHCLNGYEQLRRVSLDLRNRLPSYDEYNTLVNDGKISPGVVEDWLEDEAFALVSERFHADLLWPNLSNTKLTIPPFRILESGPSKILDVVGAAAAKRRRAWREDSDIKCLDQHQTEFETRTILNEDGTTVFFKTDDGEDTTTPMTYTVPVPMVTEINGEEVRQEGFVWVNPYWAPDTPIKVCAYAAMTNTHTPTFRDSFEPRFNSDGSAQISTCAASEALVNEGCGCGENLQYCFGPGVEKDIQTQLSQQLLRLIKAHAIDGQPYSEMLTTDRIYTNERILFWWKYLSEVTSLNREFNHYSRGNAPLLGSDGNSSLNYNDDAWFLVNRDVTLDDSGNEQQFSSGHSGILTLPGYTMRFQTNRSRANHFRINFMGEHFKPSDDIEDELAGDDCRNTAADLTQRCTCRACHITLEPMAAAWGNIAEGGSALISDRNRFPLFREECAPEVFGEANDADYDALSLRKEFCPRFWVSDPGQENPGVLKPYQFVYDPNANGEGVGGPKNDLSQLHSEIYTNLQAGPELLANEIIANGTFHRTMVNHIFEYFIGREMLTDANVNASEASLLSTLANEFQQHDNFKLMVKRIVSLPQYAEVKQ